MPLETHRHRRDLDAKNIAWLEFAAAATTLLLIAVVLVAVFLYRPA
jgi:hypothetical protein